MEVHLIDHMGNDASIVQAARVSYGQGTKTVSEDRHLIRYLMRNWHTTPFEMVEFKFRVKVPIFVARQWLRHRTASVNEVSARYSEVKNEYWVPDEYRGQSSTNKQGSSGETLTNLTTHPQEYSSEIAFDVYEGLLSKGVSRELARAHLPQSTFTEFYWKINLHNLFHFLRLRLDEHAQEEIREPAKMVFELIKPIVPDACQAFIDYRMNSISLSGPEIRAIKMNDTSELSYREKNELVHKCQLLGLTVCMTKVDASTSS
jgi:thymidylate synthase (FAD)